MDEAFKPLTETIVELVAQPPVIGGDAYGQRVVMTAIDIELPLELDVTRDSAAALHIGSTPPLYGIRTSVLPSFHHMRVRASLSPDRRDE